ncbi:Hypothetical predicted protein [Cloeon dipterum]|uniref:ZP domain-containing protein n=1 Tax=Cloeon dipterum TaxID=197152 RepID=A0A8S1DAK6_9INSE|nr:Hypothetical predicted protein [Cloeon dipterum]
MAPAMQLTTTSLFPFSSRLKTNQKVSRIGPTLMNAILASLVLVLLSNIASARTPDNTPELCVVRVLEQGLVSPWLSQPRNSPGCSSHGQLSENGTEVHVIRALLGKGTQLPRPPKADHIPIDLELDATNHNVSANPLALILNSDQPVLWRIRGQGLSGGPPITVVVSKGSGAESSLNLRMAYREWQNKKALVRFAKKSWGAITSFTEMRGANRIELIVGFGVREQSSECDTNSTKMSPVASASAILRQQAEGCFNAALAGSNECDVYVFEISHRDMIRHSDSAPPVQVILRGEKRRPVRRNITILLKAHKPTKWQLVSHGIDGKIIVISDQQVENSDMEDRQSFEVRNTELPDRMNSLLLSATNYGPLVLYARAEKANGFDVIVADTKDKEDEQLSGDMAGEEKVSDPSSLKHHQHLAIQHSALKATAVSSVKSEEKHQVLLNDLRKEMTVVCDPGWINISFPKSLSSKLGVRSITLNNPTCTSQSNTTHVWLSTRVSSCNTLRDVEKEKIMVYSNHVHVKFDNTQNEEVDENTVPVVCKYLQSKFPGNAVVLYGGEDDFEDDISERQQSPSKTSSGLSLYMMDVYKDRDHSEQLLFEEPGPAIVSINDTLYVRTWLDSFHGIQLVSDSCWISNSSNYKTRRAARVVLIKRACSAEHSVQLEDYGSERALNTHGGFSFLVHKLYAEFNNLYLHCALGMCAGRVGTKIGSIVSCEDLTQNCVNINTGFNYLSPTAQEVVTKGPFKIAPRKPKASSQPQAKLPIGMLGATKESGIPPLAPVNLPGLTLHGIATNPPSVQHTPVPETRTASVNPGNVSTEMAAVIALVAFMIGVVVTGAMWFVHVKTDPYRQGRKALHQPSLQTTHQHQRPSPALGVNGQQASSAAI